MEKKIITNLQTDHSKSKAYEESGKTSPDLTRTIEGISSDGYGSP